VRLASVNWYGAEEQDFVVGGLDFQPYQAILQKSKLLGFNSIRLPISNQLVEQNPIITAHVAANPELRSMHALEILDRIVNYAGALGISIVLDDHRSDAGWGTQADGLWYTKKYPEAAFNQDWATLAQRYTVNNVVIDSNIIDPNNSANCSNATWSYNIVGTVSACCASWTTRSLSTWSVVGSTNFDTRSFGLNDEINLAAMDSDLAARFESDFNAEKEQSVQITYHQWRRRSASCC